MLYLYLADIAGGLATLAGICFVLAALTTIVSTFCVMDSYGDELALAQKWFKRGIFGVLVAAFVLVLTPSKTTMYAFFVADVGKDYLATETGRKTVEAINRYLDGVGKDDEE